MIFAKASKYLKTLNRHPRPFKYLLARILLRTNLCRLFTIRIYGYRLRFYPSAISADLWITASDRDYPISSMLRAGDIVIDVGANIGTTVIPSSLIVGEAGKVYAFEPHPRIFSYLKGNLRLNKIVNVEAYNTALGNQKGSIYLQNNDNDDMNRICAGNEKDCLQAPIITLDSFMKEGEKIALLKIDVEGYEMFVLDGAERTLMSTECVCMEMSEKFLSEYGSSGHQAMEKLEENKFRLFKFVDSNHNIVKEISSSYSQKSENEDILAIRNIDLFLEKTGFKLSKEETLC
jgi:FkbM family methyltransferase